MLARGGQPPVVEEPPEPGQLEALADLLAFLQDHRLPPVAWTVDPSRPEVSCILEAGPRPVLDVVTKYAEMIGTVPALRRLSPDVQEFLAYRVDALNGRTSLYLSVRTPLGRCLEQPPNESTPGTLIAERDWSTMATVSFRRDVVPRSINPSDFTYRKGDTTVMQQHGRGRAPVDAKWWSTLDIDFAWIVPPDAVEVLDVIEYTSPVTAWEERDLRRVAAWPSWAGQDAPTAEIGAYRD